MLKNITQNLSITPMQITNNTIFLLNENSDKIIEHLLNHYKKVILVIDDKNEAKFNNLFDFRDVNIYSTMVKSRQLLTRHRFFFLVRNGLISGTDYNCIIFRLKKLDTMEVSTFKIFYYKHIMNKNVCSVFAFLNIINEMDPVYIHSKRFALKNDCYNIDNESHVKIVYCKARQDDTLIRYLKLKRAVNCNRYDDLEAISYRLAYEKLKSYINSDSLLLQKTKNYEQHKICEKDYYKLNITHRKFSVLKELIEDNKGKKTYVACNRAVILNYAGFFNEYIDEVDVLIYYDLIDVNIKAKKYVVIADTSIDIRTIIRVVRCMEKDKKALAFFKYLKSDEEKITTAKGAHVEKNNSHIFLIRILCHLKYLFEQHFLFISNLEYVDTYVLIKKGFQCTLKLPFLSCTSIFTENIVSQIESSKKSALHDAAFKTIKGMIDCGCLDDHLLPKRDYFIMNKVYKSWLEMAYKIKYDITAEFDAEYHKNIGLIRVHPLEYFLHVAKENRKGQNPIFITKAYAHIYEIIKSISSEHDTIYVKTVLRQKYMITLKRYNFSKIKSNAIPKCFLTDNSSFLYAFDSNIGIICGRAFNETIGYVNATFEFIGKIELTKEQMSLIALYNVIFIGLHYKKVGFNSTYCYFIVPLRNKKLFLNGFFGNLYKNQEKNENLLFNPINRNFYVFNDWSTKSILDRDVCIENGTNNTSKDSIAYDKGSISYLEYFQQKYNIKLKYTSGSDTKLLFNGYIYSPRGKKSISSVLSSEIMRVTPFSKNMFEQFHDFSQNFVCFEILALVDEARVDLNLPISLNLLSQCFMPKNDKYPDYERLECLGDCILKYIVTKFFILCFEYDIGLIVDSKCRIIENTNLTLVGKRLKLEKYLSSLIFQPPSLNNDTCRQLQYFFNFKSTVHNPQMTATNHINSEKTYADIVEALIGACYVEHGLYMTEKIVFQLKIIDALKYSDIIQDTLENFYKANGCCKKQKIGKDHVLNDPLDANISDGFDVVSYYLNADRNIFFCANQFLSSLSEYHEFMPENDILEVEKILKYKFKKKGFLEKAMIHPSARNNLFGTRSYFEKLELIGDSLLDVFVTKSIFEQHMCPYALHEARKELVNNQIYGNVLYVSGLYNYIGTCFDKEDLRNSYLVNNYKKLYGDIFEAINGAVLLDLQFKFDLYEKVWCASIKDWLWSCCESRKRAEKNAFLNEDTQSNH